MKYPVLCALLCTFLLASCAVPVSSIKQDVDLKLESDSGYLLLGIDTNATLKSVDIFGADNIRLTQSDLRPDSKFILVALEAGQYSIKNVRFNKFWRNELEEGYWDFTVVPGGISYVGHLEVVNRVYWLFNLNSSVELSNRSSEALLFMQDRFPTILQNRTLQYAGPGNDPFLLKMQQLDEQQKSNVTMQEVSHGSR